MRKAPPIDPPDPQILQSTTQTPTVSQLCKVRQFSSCVPLQSSRRRLLTSLGLIQELGP